jgi:hypothetical protein
MLFGFGGNIGSDNGTAMKAIAVSKKIHTKGVDLFGGVRGI